MGTRTKIKGVPDREDDMKPGMAHFAGTGPRGKTCSMCKHRGYTPPDWVKISYGCAMFFKLTQRPGPTVQPNWAACRHFAAIGTPET